MSLLTEELAISQCYFIISDYYLGITPGLLISRFQCYLIILICLLLIISRYLVMSTEELVISTDNSVQDIIPLFWLNNLLLKDNILLSQQNNSLFQLSCFFDWTIHFKITYYFTWITLLSKWKNYFEYLYFSKYNKKFTTISMHQCLKGIVVSHYPQFLALGGPA